MAWADPNLIESLKHLSLFTDLDELALADERAWLKEREGFLNNEAR